MNTIIQAILDSYDKFIFADDAPIMYFEKDCPVYDQSAIFKQWLLFLENKGVSSHPIQDYLEVNIPFGHNFFKMWLPKQLAAKIALSGILV